MTIAQMRAQGKALVARVPRDVLIVGVLILACLASFGLGLLAGRDGVGQASGVLVSPADAASTAPGN